MRQQNLDRDDAIKTRVESAIHRAHAASSEQSLQFVPAEVCARFESHGGDGADYSWASVAQQFKLV
jgi:hypothetical protein